MPAAESSMTPALITAIFGGIVAVIGAITGLILAVITLRKEAAAAATAALKASEEQRKEAAAANARLVSSVSEVHEAVNGTLSAALVEIARQTARVATLTGLPDDIAKAAEAQNNVDIKARATQEASVARTVAAKIAEAKA